MKWIRMTAIVMGVVSCPSGFAQTDPPCGNLTNAYGPFDYRKERGRALAIVDYAHFNSDVRNLRRGQSGTLGGDLDYVLRASPNHHGALATVSAWGVKLNMREPPGIKRSIDCYFERATRFQPDDHVARMLYVSFLQQLGLKTEALAVLAPLERLDGLTEFTHHNIGMLLMDLGEPERALVQYRKAADLGWTRPELKARLEKSGHWRESPSQQASSPASSPAEN